MQIVEDCCLVGEAVQIGMAPPQGFELPPGLDGLKGTKEIGMKRLPEGSQRTPALRPGVQRLLRAGQGVARLWVDVWKTAVSGAPPRAKALSGRREQKQC